MPCLHTAKAYTAPVEFKKHTHRIQDSNLRCLGKLTELVNLNVVGNNLTGDLAARRIRLVFELAQRCWSCMLHLARVL